MGYMATKARIFEPSRSRIVFLAIAVVAFAITEFGRYVCRPYVREHGINDFGLTDCIGNSGGIVVQIFFGLGLFNSSRKQSFRLAMFCSVGFVLYEFAQPFLPKGVFDWKDVYGTAIGYVISVLLILVVWRVVGSGVEAVGEGGTKCDPIA